MVVRLGDYLFVSFAMFIYVSAFTRMHNIIFKMNRLYLENVRSNPHILQVQWAPFYPFIARAPTEIVEHIRKNTRYSPFILNTKNSILDSRTDGFWRTQHSDAISARLQLTTRKWCVNHSNVLFF